MERNDKVINITIFDESVTLIRTKLGFDAALNFGNKMRHSKAVKTLKVTEEIENKAWDKKCICL